MRVDIWSDVRCPFCYIGKRNFEKGLAQFADKDKIEVVWHSYELDPTLKTDENIDILDYFVESKGMPKDQAQQMLAHPIAMGKSVGIDFQFEKSILANSFKAHRLIQMAQANGLGNEAEEALFKAHFTDGVNIDSDEELLKLGLSIGLEKEKVEELFTSAIFEQEVKQDIFRAQQLGIRGVPYFVFNDKYAVSGAQPMETFLGALEKSYSETIPQNNFESLGDGEACGIDGNCD